MRESNKEEEGEEDAFGLVLLVFSLLLPLLLRLLFQAFRLTHFSDNV